MSDLHLYALRPDGATKLETPAGAHELHDLSLPDGIYEGLRTFEHNRFLFLDRHLARAERGISMLGWKGPLERETICRGLHEAVTAYPHADARARVDVFEHAEEVLGVEARYLLALAPFLPVSAEVLERGVEVGVARGMERVTPKVKRNEWITRRRGSGPGDAGFYEHLLLDAEERILEGSSCNVFCLREGELLTAEIKVLGGIQRGVFLELAEREGIPTRIEAVPLAETQDLDEMFLTSSTRAAVPIVRVEGRDVGSGKPGPIWRRLLASYRELSAEARPAVERP